MKLSVLLFLVFVSWVALTPAQAQTSWTWTAPAASGNWSDATNWTPSGGIVSGTTTQLEITGGNGSFPTITSNNDLAGFTLNSLSFLGASGVQLEEVTGNALVLAASPTGSATVSVPNVVAEVENDLAIDDGLDVSSTGSLSLDGAISGSGSIAISGTGTVALTNTNNSFAGGIALTGQSATGSFSGSQFTITGPTLTAAADTVLGAAGTSIALTGATLAMPDGFTSSRPITLGGAAEFAETGTATGTEPILSGSITGTGTVALSGRVALTGSNTFVGDVLATGTNSSSSSTVLTVGADASLGGAANNLVLTEAELDVPTGFSSARGIAVGGVYGSLSTTGSAVFSGVVTGTAALAVLGSATDMQSGTITLTGTNTYSGGTAIYNQVAVASDANLGDPAGHLFFLGGILETQATLASMRTASGKPDFAPDAGTTLTLTGSITGTQLIQSGTGTLVITGTNTTSATSITAGTLVAGSTTALGSGTVTMADGAVLDLDGQSPTVGGLVGNGGTITNNGSSASTLTLQLNGTGDQYFGAIDDGASPVGVAINSGSSSMPLVQYLLGTSTYSGGTSVTNTLLVLGYDASLGAVSGTLTLNTNAGIYSNLGLATARPIVLAGSGINAGVDFGQSITLSGTISGTGSLTIGGGDGGALAGVGGGTVILTGTNTFTGGAAVTAGTLQVFTDANLGDPTGTLTVGAAVFESSGSFTTARPVFLSNPSSMLLQDSGTTLTLTGTISGPSFILLNGQGTLRLLGDDQTYGAIINSGTVVVGGTSEIQNGGAFSARGGAMYMAASINCVLQVRAGATFTAGLSASSPGTAATSNQVTLSDGAVLNFALGQTTGSGSIVSTGAGFDAPTSGTVTLNLFNSGDVAAGTYQLITGTNIEGATAANFVVGHSVPGYSAAVSVNATGVSVTLTPQSGGYAAWAASYFPGQENNPAVSGETATPQGDGVPNLLKYAYGFDPSVPMTAAERALLPAVSSSGSDLTVTYYLNPNATGVTLQAQSSPDLQTWTNISSQDVGTDPGTGDVMLQATAAVTGRTLFLRVVGTDGN